MTTHQQPIKHKDINSVIDQLLSTRPNVEVSDQILVLTPIYKTDINPKYEFMLHEIQWDEMMTLDNLFIAHKDQIRIV